MLFKVLNLSSIVLLLDLLSFYHSLSSTIKCNLTVSQLSKLSSSHSFIVIVAEILLPCVWEGVEIKVRASNFITLTSMITQQLLLSIGSYIY
jgi:hypothetical protein